MFTDALELEGLMDAVMARIDLPDGRTGADPTVDDEHRPVLLAVSDNGPQMTSESTGNSWPYTRSPCISGDLGHRPIRRGSRRSSVI